MPAFDPFQPVFSQRDVSACVGLSKPILDSYILQKHVKPFSIGGRRAFSAVQMVEIVVLNMLASDFGMPPSKGRDVSRRLLQAMPEELIRTEADLAQEDEQWAAQASRREQVTASEGIDIIFPVQMFMRRVFGRARAIFVAAHVEQEAVAKVDA